MKVFIKNNQSPGDVIMLTAAVRDLKLSHPDIEIGISTPAMQIWENNPHILHDMEESDADEVIHSEYELIHKSNQLPYHFIHGFRKDLEKKLDLKIPVTAFHGDIHLSEDEKGWVSQVEEGGHKNDFWIVMAGGKFDFTAKWWDPDKYQRVVNRLEYEIKFVQCGADGHWHNKLNNVIDLVGKTDIRQFIRLMYHAQGVLCPVTFAMHLAAAVPTKKGMPKNRPCVVIAGGREPAQWEAYPHHRYLSTNGALLCCDDGGCWKSRCQTVGDSDKKDDNLCTNPIRINEALSIPKCMDLISVMDVVSSIKKYFNGGAINPIQYGGGKNQPITIKAKKEIAVYGVKRSGNHMLLDWIINQHSGKNFFLNDVSRNPRKETIVNGTKSESLPCYKNIIRGSDAKKDGVNLFLYSYEEDYPCNKSHKSIDSEEFMSFIVLREFRNWISSVYCMFSNKRNVADRMARFMPLWKQFAELYLSGDQDRFILYDNFISSEEYRDSIALKIGVDLRTDGSMARVPSYGGYSSFDGSRKNGMAHEMDVLNRYKEMEDMQWYKAVLKDNPEIMELNREIFG